MAMQKHKWYLSFIGILNNKNQHFIHVNGKLYDISNECDKKKIIFR